MQVTITNTNTQSDAVRLNSSDIVGVIPDAAFDNADITFQVAYDDDAGVTWHDVLDDSGAAVKLTGCRANKLSVLSQNYGYALQAFHQIRLVSSVAQAGDTVIQIVTRRL